MPPSCPSAAKRQPNATQGMTSLHTFCVQSVALLSKSPRHSQPKHCPIAAKSQPSAVQGTDNRCPIAAKRQQNAVQGTANRSPIETKMQPNAVQAMTNLHTFATNRLRSGANSLDFRNQFSAASTLIIILKATTQRNTMEDAAQRRILEFYCRD